LSAILDPAAVAGHGRVDPDAPLAGIRIVDWTQYGVGPFATALLGALGADVIHVETPRGDPQRFIPPTVNGTSSLYINFNTNKRSIHLDLRHEADRESMWNLIEGADVLVNNFRPGSVARLGFDPEAVLACNPSIVYCLSNGWGEGGPRAEQPGSDPPMQLFSGWCSITGPEGGPWEFMRFLGHVDLNASIYTTAAVLTGLACRFRQGGQVIRVSMLEAALAMQCTRLAEYLGGGVLPGPLGSAAGVIAPSQAFRGQDKSFIAISVETEAQWRRLCEAIGRDDLTQRQEYATNAERVSNRSALAEELGAVIATKPVTWWMQQLTRSKVPCGRFWDFEMIRVHPQVLENEHLVEIELRPSGRVYTGGPPWQFDEVRLEIERSPDSGEHTEEILRELSRSKPQAPAHESVAAPAALPFAGLRVIELASGIAGPYCGSMFADQGAEVLKLEPPEGDRTRGWGPPFVGGVGAAFVELNRNKKLLGQENVSAGGSPHLHELLRTADVVILDAFDTDGERAGLDLDALRRAHSRLIVCSISPYGDRGPLAGQPGSELIIQALANTFAGLGEIGEPPRRLGADQASTNGGVAAYQAIVAALIRRERTGRGGHVRTSLLGMHLAIKGMHWTSLSSPEQWPGQHLSVWTDPPNHGVRTADRPIMLQLPWEASRAAYIGNDTPGEEEARSIARRFGAQLDEVPNRFAEQGTPRHVRHPRWREVWSGVFEHHPAAEVERIVSEEGGAVTPFTDYAYLDRDPQIAFLEPFVPLEGGDENGTRVVRLPWRMQSLARPLSYRAARPVHENVDGAETTSDGDA